MYQILPPVTDLQKKFITQFKPVNTNLWKKADMGL